ncbi:TPA: hypothetical protein NNQ18_004696 [Salmonella enterica]|nr:hypothetical protein [Salmonella enterica]HCH8414876.1 hypothetical protein [Salmonella enterica]HCH8780899.1 hypothetical protein [Salmonella enterica]
MSKPNIQTQQNGITDMYGELLTGSQAKTEMEKGNDVEVVVRGTWQKVNQSNAQLLRSDLYIFRVCPTKRNEMLDEIKANRLLLDNCPRHFFKLGKIQLGEKAQCLRCGGWFSLTTLGDYIRGVVAAGGNPCDVCPDWYGETISGSEGWHFNEPVRCPQCKGAGTPCIVCNDRGSLPRVDALVAIKDNHDVR